MLYSIIVPVYNRPDEINELLSSLTRQTFTDFEVLIIEDGSDERCESIAERYSGKLNIRYYYKENSGQGFSRNYGFERAKGEYFVVFDSDCIIPEHYFEAVNRKIKSARIDCWGGPDRAHPSFTPVQKAISYSMTSPLTTGGIRGGKKRIGQFHPRSFNMGISREVFEQTGGYKITRMGEDIEFSLRIIKSGFRTALIPDAYVYHKRRTNFGQFFRQLHFFGRARVNIRRFYPDQLQTIHLLPVLFLIGIPASLLFLVLRVPVAGMLPLLYLLYAALLFTDSYRISKSLNVALLSVPAAFIQLTAYGAGLIQEMFREIRD
ncbi:glycosyltransferase [Rhodohalobacter mucosus]|uniref:Glycosyltransferase n=1 Tax=Rhodohalobacter mucosus TaxID=2079485 RepID=A0A316TV17_9BACT|nr:glycosyltransferase [Rhodohalobacter mucosus]PWN06184.1 glycosyltransferase [Rhodohalobacter mucosus]